jgi:type II secretory pathway pseudopilin PulG
VRRAALTRSSSRGFTYIGLLIAVALLGIGLAFTGQVWHTGMQREKEKELIFVGDQFRKAIAAYYAANTGVSDRYPKSFEELLRDTRQPAVRRYLRKVYADPLTGTTEWGLIKSPGGGIMGVYSLAEGHPLKQADSAFPSRYANFSGATKYVGWQFVFAGADGAAAPPSADAGQSSQPPVVTQPSAPPPPQVAAVPPSKPTDLPDRRCPAIASYDARVCAAQKAKWGNADDCLMSAQLRQAACQAGQTLPALFVRYL